MRHFQHLRLKQHKGLKSAVLHDLGKTNVICGPNNSGKTSILECIADKNLHVLGVALDADATARIERRKMTGKTWQQQRFADAFPKMLSEVAGKQSVWFSDEANTFWTELLGFWRKTFTASTPGDQSAVQNAFQVVSVTGSPRCVHRCDNAKL